MSSFFFALNSYFAEKRGQAMGISMTITGIGPIIFPLIISYLLYFYGSQVKISNKIFFFNFIKIIKYRHDNFYKKLRKVIIFFKLQIFFRI